MVVGAVDYAAATWESAITVIFMDVAMIRACPGLGCGQGGGAVQSQPRRLLCVKHVMAERLSGAEVDARGEYERTCRRRHTSIRFHQVGIEN